MATIQAKIGKNGVWHAGLLDGNDKVSVHGEDIVCNENYMPNSKEMGLGTSNYSTGTWRLAGSNTMTRSRVYIPDSPIGPCYGLQNSGQQTDTSDASCYGIDSFPRVNGETYTASFYARLTSGTGGMAGFAFYNATYISGTNTRMFAAYYMTPLTNEWTRCSYTFTSTSASANIYIGVGTSGSDVTVQMCGFKLEKGSVATPWIPAPGELKLGSTMSIDNPVEANQFYEF